ncbi:predicted protein [Sclerotinia sclerotiorum 1980 UF-70]|uniref:Uncharacterized protein n=1 Tax=Sclerotinia sclerotiorum (strain ATCC 18683 / 1980 / Ss-1) TaxID=665079 RepID=A7ET77_SCLS1|nr:predicted protein [Sclerotinia sclerotiorum 1980 UF-70]EDN92669.1 predicted protein [Sclerotinia sclerotiorum 1980 UF-70]
MSTKITTPTTSAKQREVVPCRVRGFFHCNTSKRSDE